MLLGALHDGSGLTVLRSRGDNQIAAFRTDRHVSLCHRSSFELGLVGALLMFAVEGEELLRIPDAASHSYQTLLCDHVTRVDITSLSPSQGHTSSSTSRRSVSKPGAVAATE